MAAVQKKKMVGWRSVVVLSLWRWLLVLLHEISCVGAFSVLAKSDLVKCERTSAGGPISDCRTKVVTTVTITNESREKAATLHFTQWNVKTANGSDLQMRFGLNIALVKGEVWNYYPLDKLQYFNAKPYEVLFYTKSGNCQADPTQRDVTCHWMQRPNPTNGVMEIIPDSQGFCCSCGYTTWFAHNGIYSAYRRGGDEMHCNKFYKFEQSDSASCLRFNETWYQGFSISEPSLNFKIMTTYEYERRIDDPTGKPPSTTTPELVMVSPVRREATSKDGNMMVSLQGDFLNYKGFPQMGGNFLCMPPQLDKETPYDYKTRWLILSKDLFTLNGMDCNKIGISYSGFRNQPGDKCSEPPNTCLNSQLQDYASHEKFEVGIGQPRYSAIKYGDVKIAQDGFDMKANSQLFAIMVNQIMVSVVILEVAATGMEFVVNRSPGKILSVSVPTFEASTRFGHMNAVIQNTGTIPSEYHLQVHSCSNGIIDPQEQTLTLAPGAILTVTIQIETVDFGASERSCKVDLLDSFAVPVSSSVCQFQTSATEFSKGEQSGEVAGPEAKGLGNYTDGWSFTNPKSWFRGIGNFLGNIGSGIKNGFGKVFGSCGQCGVFNIICALKNLCWSRMVQSIGFILLIIGGIIAFGFLSKNAIIFEIVFKIFGKIGSICFKCCRSSSVFGKVFEVIKTLFSKASNIFEKSSRILSKNVENIIGKVAESTKSKRDAFKKKLYLVKESIKDSKNKIVAKSKDIKKRMMKEEDVDFDGIEDIDETRSFEGHFNENKQTHKEVEIHEEDDERNKDEERKEGDEEKEKKRKDSKKEKYKEEESKEDEEDEEREEDDEEKEKKRKDSKKEKYKEEESKEDEEGEEREEDDEEKEKKRKDSKKEKYKEEESKEDEEGEEREEDDEEKEKKIKDKKIEKYKGEESEEDEEDDKREEDDEEKEMKRKDNMSKKYKEEESEEDEEDEEDENDEEDKEDDKEKDGDETKTLGIQNSKVPFVHGDVYVQPNQQNQFVNDSYMQNQFAQSTVLVQPYQQNQFFNDPYMQNQFVQDDALLQSYQQNQFSNDSYMQNQFSQDGVLLQPYQQNQFSNDLYMQNQFSQDGVLLQPYQQNQFSNDLYMQNQFSQDGVHLQPYQQNLFSNDPYQQNQFSNDLYQQNQFSSDPYQQNQFSNDPYQQNQFSNDPYQQNQFSNDPYMQNQFSQDGVLIPPYQQSQFSNNPSIQDQTSIPISYNPMYNDKNEHSSIYYDNNQTFYNTTNPQV